MESDAGKVSFTTAAGFCPDCGSILPLLGDRGGVTCYTCDRKWGADGIIQCYFDCFMYMLHLRHEVFGDMAMSYTLHFNTKHTYASAKQKSNEEDDEAEGPVVERRCPQCNNDKMSYATLQLRSADEGQTVFYTCTKCKFKETENS